MRPETREKRMVDVGTAGPPTRRIPVDSSRLTRSFEEWTPRVRDGISTMRPRSLQSLGSCKGLLMAAKEHCFA